MKNHSLNILLIALTGITGCYSYMNVSKEDFANQTKQRNAMLISHDKTEQQFNLNEYLIAGDSITVISLNKVSEGDYSLIKSIHLDDILVYKLQKFDPVKAILLAAGIAGIVYLVASILSTNALFYSLGN